MRGDKDGVSGNLREKSRSRVDRASRVGPDNEIMFEYPKKRQSEQISKNYYASEEEETKFDSGKLIPVKQITKNEALKLTKQIRNVVTDNIVISEISEHGIRVNHVETKCITKLNNELI